MAQALLADTIRGDDSTGAFFVPHELPEGETADFCKSTAPGYDFVTYDKDWRDKMEGEEHFAVIGHNRAATIGAISSDTAHPFQRGPITLVHNGTLRGTHQLPTPQHRGQYHNDSDTIAANLEQAPIWELTPEMNGAYALIWHDARDNSMNILRNNERPLHLARVKHQDTIFIASEALMMQWILGRLRMDIEIMAFPKALNWLRWEHGELTPAITEVKPYRSNFGAANSNYPSGHGHHYGQPWEDYLYDEEADAEWTRTTPIAPPKTERPALPPPTKIAPETPDSRIWVGGRKRQVPVKAQELLLEFDLLVEDREKFEPEYTAAGSCKKTKTVIGCLPDTGMAAIAYKVPKTWCESQAMGRTWVAQPVAIKMNDPLEPVVVCKIRLSDSDSPRGQAMLSVCKTSGPGSEDGTGEVIAEDQAACDKLKIAGPQGKQIPLNEYIDKTGGGCIQCGGNIYVGDALKLIWVNDSRDPMCSSCVEDMYGTVNSEVNDAN